MDVLCLTIQFKYIFLKEKYKILKAKHIFDPPYHNAKYSNYIN